MKLTFRTRYRAKLLCLLGIYSLVLWCLFTLLTATEYYVSQALCVLIAVFLVLAIVYFWERQLSLLEVFFQSARHEDFAQRYSRNNLSDELADSLNAIIEKLQQRRSAEYTQNHFLNSIIRQAPVAILAFDERYRISLFNHAASRLLVIKAPTTLNDLAMGFERLPSVLKSLGHNHDAVYKLYREGLAYNLKLSARQIVLANNTQTIVCIENIGKEINQAEYTAWRDLIGVLSHEMMNSITPIVALADNCFEVLTQPGLLALPATSLEQEIDDTKRALSIIAKRSQGIVEFVSSYRELSKLPIPCLQNIHLGNTISAVVALTEAKLKDANITFKINIAPDNLHLQADKHQLEQVLINILNNAADACKKSPLAGRIVIGASLRNSHIVISIEDNGGGIDEEALAHVFTPFFTTKRDGMGIGMSITRQVMHAHGGQISLKSTLNKGTLIELIF